MPVPVTGATGVTEYRPLLFSIAYGMTGSVGDAEDIVQDAFLGLTRARQAGTVITDPKPYLTTTVTRLGINYLRSARVRRETYVGDWLPEPIVVPADRPGPAEHAELADSLSIAFLVLLEALSPVERAVFMLREAFGYGYPDIARITGKTEVNCRQIFTRAKRRIAAGGQARRGAPAPARRAEGEELARRFFEAADGGDMDSLLDMLAPDVVVHGDGGGKAQAIGKPLAGRQRVMLHLINVLRLARNLGLSFRLAWINGQPGAVLYDAAGRVASVIELDVADGVIQAIHAVVNPDKLGHLGPVSDVARLPEKDLPRPPRRAKRASRVGRTRRPLGPSVRVTLTAGTGAGGGSGGLAFTPGKARFAGWRGAAGRRRRSCGSRKRSRRTAATGSWTGRHARCRSLARHRRAAGPAARCG
jgi:RNA polymerase sigma factor (sigma-70 family)